MRILKENEYIKVCCDRILYSKNPNILIHELKKYFGSLHTIISYNEEYKLPIKNKWQVIFLEKRGNEYCGFSNLCSIITKI